MNFKSDFTGIFIEAGGARFSDDDSKEEILNVDYIIGNVIIELKLVEEEGLGKVVRQQKLSSLFLKYDDSSPVVVIDPNKLTSNDRRKYFNILEGPVKTHVKKASKQLKSTSDKLGGRVKKILLIANNGYSSVGTEEFKSIVSKCVRNDTSNVDYVITCGIYYYNDGFESHVIAPFEIEGIYERSEPCEFAAIRDSWNRFLNKYVTKFFMESTSENNARLPVLDLEFDVNGVTFIKPAPPFGKESEYWVAGRPRIDTSGLDVCPAVGTVFPKLSRHSWSLLKEALEDSWILKESYELWVKFSLDEAEEYGEIIRPFIPVFIEYDTLLESVENKSINRFYDLCNYANGIFCERIHEIILSARNIDDTRIDLAKYILLINREIGRDKKNDLCSIYVARNVGEPIILETLVKNERIFFEYGVSLASSYALKNNISMVLYQKDKEYVWG